MLPRIAVSTIGTATNAVAWARSPVTIAVLHFATSIRSRARCAFKYFATAASTSIKSRMPSGLCESGPIPSGDLLELNMKLTTKQVKEVGCPTCGAQPKMLCRLATGKSRTSLHRERRLVATECFALTELTAELAELSKKQSQALQAAPFPKMYAEEKAEYEKRRLRIGELCELVGKYKPK
jgi:hypothetical protein